MEFKLKPWTTPNFVRMEMPPRPRQEGFHEAPAIPLKDVDAKDLALLCDQFRREIFKKAGKRDPGLVSGEAEIKADHREIQVIAELLREMHFTPDEDDGKAITWDWTERAKRVIAAIRSRKDQGENEGYPGIAHDMLQLERQVKLYRDALEFIAHQEFRVGNWAVETARAVLEQGKEGGNHG